MEIRIAPSSNCWCMINQIVVQKIVLRGDKDPFTDGKIQRTFLKCGTVWHHENKPRWTCLSWLDYCYHRINGMWTLEGTFQKTRPNSFMDALSSIRERKLFIHWFIHVKIEDKDPDQIRSVAQSCLTLCNPMNCSTPGLPVHHQLLEFTETHVHRVSDAIQPSHPLASPSPPAHNPFRHHGLFQWVNSSHEVAKVLEFQLYHHSFQRNPRADLQNGLVGSPCRSRDSQESSPTPQFKSINSSALSLLLAIPALPFPLAPGLDKVYTQ